MGRLASLKKANNATRDAFMKAVADMFGGEDRIPDSVKDAMKLEDYGKGKPLTARRILAVKAAIDQVAEQARQATEKTDNCIADGKAWMREKNPDIYKKGDVDKLVETAFSGCDGNTDALDIVKDNLRSFMLSQGGEIRSEGHVRNRAEGLAANLNELKALSAKIPGLYEAGRRMLERTAKPLPPNVLSALVKAANEAPIDSLKKLSGSSSGLAIHKAVMEAFKTVEDIMNSTGADRKMEGSDEREPARQFVLDVMLSRCGRGALEKIGSALTGDAAAHLLAYYDECSGPGGKELFPNEPEAVRDGISDMGDLGKIYFSRIASSASAHLERLSPNAQPIEQPDYDYQPDIDGLGGDRLLSDTVSLGRELNSRTLEKHIGKTVEGSGRGADAMKNILRQKLEGVHDPDRNCSQRLKANANAMINWQICTEMRKFVTGAESYFAKDINRGLNVTFTDGRKTFRLTNDFDKARDEIAQFVTGDGNATYNSISQEDRNKVNVITSFLSQEMEKVAEDGTAYSLDKREADMAFQLGPDKTRPSSRTFSIEKSGSGGISVQYSLEKSFKSIVTDEFADGVDVGAGSTYKAEVTYQLSAGEFTRVANLDYSKFDDSEAYKVFNKKQDIPDGTRKYAEQKNVKLLDTFGEEFKLKASCQMNFSMKVMPSDEDLIEAQR